MSKDLGRHYVHVYDSPNYGRLLCSHSVVEINGKIFVSPDNRLVPLGACTVEELEIAKTLPVKTWKDFPCEDAYLFAGLSSSGLTSEELAKMQVIRFWREGR